MAHRSLTTWLAPVFAGLFLLSGCSRTLVKDEIHVAKTSGNHCSGSEGVDDSSLAVLTLPVVAFFVPHWELNEVKADDFLRRGRDHPNHQPRNLAVVSGPRLLGSGPESVRRANSDE